MSRPETWGTPGRSKHYVHPRRAWRFLLPALALAVVVPAFVLFGHLLGVRKPLSPGDLVSAHAGHESRCEECHAPRQGASNVRCQRCHDPSGAGRLANAGHVLFGSRDAKKAAAAPNLACASCHVEHRGRAAELDRVDEAHCVRCHFKGLGSHPDFTTLTRQAREVPGLLFNHQRHLAELAKATRVSGKEACLRCHEPKPATRDFEAVAFDRHCASCHAKEGSLGTIDPISQEDVMPVEAIAATGVSADWVRRTPEFEVSRGRVAKTAVQHRDEWVLWNAARLRRQLDPDGYARERGALLARLSQLQRRLALATPLAALDLPALRGREATLELELKGVDARLRAQAAGAEPGAGLTRIQEIAEAVRATADAAAAGEAAGLEERAQALRRRGVSSDPLPTDAYDTRRKELLALLDALQARDPTLKPRVEDLRRRLLALVPGDTGTELLERVRAQRDGELQRVRDEIALREAGTPPPPGVLMAAQRKGIDDALRLAQARLEFIGRGGEGPAVDSDEVRERKEESLDVLLAPCVKCHLRDGAALKRVGAARPVLVRSVFVHQPHLLQAECSRCHPGVDASTKSSDLNFKGVDSCRECHRRGGVRQDCQTCHRYHPPPIP